MANQTQVMSEFATLIGMDNLEPDETGLYSLLVDDDYTVFLQSVGEMTLIISTGIGIIPDHEAPAVCRALLESNNFWLESGGFSLSLVPGSLQVLLSGRADFAAPNSSSLRIIVEIQRPSASALNLSRKPGGRSRSTRMQKFVSSI